jgi:hypothetical protein
VTPDCPRRAAAVHRPDAARRLRRPYDIPRGERLQVVAALVRDLAGLVVAHARRQVDAVAEQLGDVAKGQ